MAKSLVFSIFFTPLVTAAARFILPDPGIPDMPMKMRLLGPLLLLSAKVVLAGA